MWIIIVCMRSGNFEFILLMRIVGISELVVSVLLYFEFEFVFGEYGIFVVMFVLLGCDSVLVDVVFFIGMLFEFVLMLFCWWFLFMLYNDCFKGLWFVSCFWFFWFWIVLNLCFNIVLKSFLVCVLMSWVC